MYIEIPGQYMDDLCIGSIYGMISSPGFPPADLPATPAHLILAGTGFARL